MQLQPFGWSVVLLGKWNAGILSPNGIAKYVFGLPSDSKIQVAVPLDGISAFQVKNPEETLIVHVEHERLQVDLLKCNYETLQEGMAAGIKALKALPVTPISAVGFNLKLKTKEVCQALVTATDAAIDTAVGDKGYRITGRSVARALSFGEGQINLTVLRKGDEFSVNCNFHLTLATEDREKAEPWLATTTESIKDEIAKIAAVLDVQLQEDTDD